LYKNRKYRNDDIFYWEKQQAEYLYKFTVVKIHYQNLLNHEHKRATFAYQVYGMQKIIEDQTKKQTLILTRLNHI
jgi:hypothetical protein